MEITSMVANAGTIEAQLILNASQFQKQMQAAMASAQNMGNAFSTNLSKASKTLSGATSEVTRFHQRLGEAKSFASSLGDTVTKQAKQIQAAFSKILPGDALAKQFSLGSRAILTMADEARKVNAQFSQLSNAATNAGKSAKNAFPIEYIEKTSNAMRNLNQQVTTAAGSYAATGRSFLASTNEVNSGASKTSSIFQQVGSAGSAAFSKVGSGIMAAGNSLATLTNSVVSFNVWMGALVGAAFFQFTVGAAMAVEEAKSLFTFVGMSAGEVERLDQSTAKYAESASKVSQPEMLSGWRLIRLSHKMSADEMTKYNSTLGDTIGLFKANGRTAEDAGRAIEDAMAGGSDGIKRLKEIGISDMQELYDRGFDPSKPETFFAALQKLYEDKGIAGYGSKVTSLSDRFENLKEKIQLAGIAAGEVLMPGMEAMVNGLTAIFEGLGPQVSGAIIAFTGLSIILGFFWPTLVTIGSGASLAAGKVLELAGGTLKYKTAADGAKTSSIAWGDTLGGLDKKMVGAVAGVAVMVAALAGLTYYISQTMSATVGWNNAEKEKKTTVDSLNAQNKTLQSNIEDLTSARQLEANAGRSTVDIDNRIAANRQRIAENTQAAADAEVAWTNAQTMRTNLESLGQGKISSAKTRAKAAELGITPEDYVKLTGTTAEYNDELEKTAKLNMNIYSVYDQQAGTIDKVNKGESNYSKLLRDNKTLFDIYKGAYDSFAQSNENFWLALDKGDIIGTIWYGIESGYAQAAVAVIEYATSSVSTLYDIADKIKAPLQEVYNAIVTPIQNAINTVKRVWDSFWSGLADTGVITELQAAFGEVESAVDTLNGAFLEVKEAFADVWNELSGAFNEIGSAFAGVWNELSEPISELVNTFKDLIWPAKEVGGAVKEVGNTAKENKEPLVTLKDIIKWVADGIRATIPYIRMFADGIRWAADRVMELAEFLRWVADGVSWMSAQFSSGVAWIQGAWSGAVNFIQVMWDYIVNFVITRWNAAVGAVTGNPVVARMWDYASWVIDSIINAWRAAKAIIESLPIIGQLVQSGGPPSAGGGDSGGGGGAFSGPLSRGTKSFLNMASGFTYLPYGGIGQSISQTLSNFAGNCVDGSLAQIALANAWGIPAELIQTTWMGNPHVYARIAGQDKDIANHALTGSWRAPPRGPGGSGSGNIIIQGDVYGYNDFVKKVEQANNKLTRRY